MNVFLRKYPRISASRKRNISAQATENATQAPKFSTAKGRRPSGAILGGAEPRSEKDRPSPRLCHFATPSRSSIASMIRRTVVGCHGRPDLVGIPIASS